MNRIATEWPESFARADLLRRAAALLEGGDDRSTRAALLADYALEARVVTTAVGYASILRSVLDPDENAVAIAIESVFARARDVLDTPIPYRPTEPSPCLHDDARGGL